MGTRKISIDFLMPLWDHPHAYGDKLVVLLRVFSVRGSSPRVWGQGGVSPTIFNVTGIIPTRMGTRCEKCGCEPYRQDHPHAYGDKFAAVASFHSNSGSSPRVWGQANGGYTQLWLAGIIPTRMGTRLKKSRKIAVLQNQPLRFPLTFHRSFV